MLGPGFRFDNRRLRGDEVREAAELACRAFDSGPFFIFAFPEDRRRARGVRIIHRTLFAHPGPAARFRTVRDSRNRIVGLSLWLPTGHSPLPVTSQLAQLPGALRSCNFSPRVLKTGIAYSRTTQPLHPKVPHWYLNVLMTEPAAQGQGIGTALMDEAVTDIDTEGVGAYLETNNESNVAYYAKFGFEVQATLRPVPLAPPRYTLWREPAEPQE
jgi:ribosomal protein S18 acetylase RimI-like enzyme